MNRRTRGVLLTVVVLLAGACTGSGEEDADALVGGTTTFAQAEPATDVESEAQPDATSADEVPQPTVTPTTNSQERADHEPAPDPDPDPDPGPEPEPDPEPAPEPESESEPASDFEADPEPETTSGAPVDSEQTSSGPSDQATSRPASAPGAGSGGGASSVNATAQPMGGTSVSGPDLVPDDDLEPSCGASLDNPCLPATNGHRPTEAIAMGEYQTNVVVPDGAILDVYFDQSRPPDQIERLCREMGGVLHVRPSDGSPWVGWSYCAHVDYP